MKKTKHPIPAGALVGTIHDAPSLRRALRLAPSPTPPDWLEIRLDALVPPAAAWARLRQRPLVLTVRAAAEGGRRRYNVAARQRLFLEHLPHASFLDLEIASWHELRAVHGAARREGVGLIASFHDFDGTPSLRRLKALADRAVSAGAAVLKIATTTDDAGSLARLLEFLSSKQRLPVSAMGMGRLGRVSRLSLGAAGSALNYVSLGPPAATGQWPAALFQRRLAELL